MGYPHPAWYSISTLESFLRGCVLEGRGRHRLGDLYNHTTGKHDLTVDLVFRDKPLVIVEGMYSSRVGGTDLLQVARGIVRAEAQALLGRFVARDAEERKICDAGDSSIERFKSINGRAYAMIYRSALRDFDFLIDTSRAPVLAGQFTSRLAAVALDP